jgi:pyruvate-formate lyase-activating enzyme
MLEQAEQTARLQQAPVRPGVSTLPRDRVQELAGELSPARRGGIEEALTRLTAGEAIDLGDPAWAVLSQGLTQGFLGDFDVTRPQFQEMVRLLKVGDKEMLQTFIRIYQGLRRAPLEQYESLAEALGQGGFRAEARDFMRQFLRQLFVIAINRRLQLLYQAYLVGRPFEENSTEDDRIRHFHPLEDLVHRLLAAAGPQELLGWLGIDPTREALEDFAMALNKYEFDPYRVNFRFTHHCNIQCAHCYNFSGPHKKSERIERDAMLRIVAEMPRTGIASMNLTGGEPFMYLDTLLALVEAGREAGVTEISIYTNGFFAKSEDSCRKVLARMKDAGFMEGIGRQNDHIKVSAGVYHQEFLPFETVINLIKVYREVFDKNVVVDYEVLEQRRDLEEEIRRELQDQGVAELVDIHFRGIAAVGRGAQFDPELKHHPLEAFRACGAIDEIVFDPDGSVSPCCGMNFGNQGIAIGNIHGDGLVALLMRMENNPILQFIAKNPIGSIYDHLDKAPARGGYADICNLCQHALADLKENQDLKRNLASIQEFFPFWFTGEKLRPR